KEQEKLIEEQKARISELEIQTAEQIAKITALTENLVQAEAKIAEDEKQITFLTNKTEQLTNTLRNERKLNQEKIEKMNADFADQTRKAEEAHKAEVKGLQTKLDDADAAHAQYVARLNEEFADKSNLAEQKRINDLKEQQTEFESQIEKIKKSNADAATAVNAKHASEIRKVQKSVDRRVEAARKDAEKQYNALVKQLKAEHNREMAEVKRKAKEEVRLAKQKAKEEVKIAKRKARKNLFTEEELKDIDN
ncbi:MAG: hypothetical protein UHD05_01980, partial [Ruminococcus sp.]|nr:hypothetical protein [Ruminococcus sp.]